MDKSQLGLPGVDTKNVARLRRNYLPGAVHHAIARFHAGAYRLRDPTEREEYLRRLATGLEKTDWHLLAYALMSAHIHLVLLAGVAPPDLIFKSAHSSFAPWLNRRQRVHGQLFSGRYRLWAVKRPTAELLAYVHNNPVRAGVVARAGDSRWTSHRYYASSEASPGWLASDRGLALAGFDDGATFDGFVDRAGSRPRDPLWSGEFDSLARHQVSLATGAATGLSEPVIGDRSIYEASLRPRTFTEAHSNFTPEQILGAIAVVIGIPRRDFCGRSKRRDTVRGRRLALRLWRGMRGAQVEMTSALGMSPSSSSCLLQSCAAHHLAGDEDRVWAELLRCYPQRI